jgi:ABC-2 type transport system permease protein
MNIGMGVLAKEASGKTVDFLLTKPVSRTAIITAKLLAALSALAITSLVFFVVSGAMAAAVSENLDYWMFLKLSLPLFFVQVIFALLGFAIAAVARKIKSVLPLSLSTVFAFFIIGLVQGALHYEDLRYLTPFKYFDYGYILKNASYEGTFLLLSAVIVVVAAVLSYVVFLKKDIHAA